MNENNGLYDLAKLYDTTEDKDTFAKNILNKFMSLTRIEQLDTVDHYFTEVRHCEQLKLIQKELFDEETIVKRHDQKVKLWLFKAITIFGLVVIFCFIFVLDSLDRVDCNSSTSTLENLIKFMAKLLFS